MIDDKELIALAQASDELDPLRDMDKNVAQFVMDSGMIEDTNGCVNFTHIHWTYVKWCQFKDLPIMYHNLFSKELQKKFKKRNISTTKVSRSVFYFVNKEPFIVDDKEIWTMRAYYRKRRKFNGYKEKI